MKKIVKTKEEYEDAIAKSHSIAEALRYLGIKSEGGNYRIIHNAIKAYNISIDHFTGKGWNIGLKFKPKEPCNMDEILVEYSTYQTFKLKNRLLKEGYKEYKCESCGSTEWKDYPIPLELHHINGDNTDHRIENLQILCPNCHALTVTYCKKKSALQETEDVEFS